MNPQNQRHRILSKLLDRFESSTHERMVSLPFTQKFYPEYFHAEDPSKRDDINAAALALEAEGLIRIEWKKFSEKHELKRVILNGHLVQRAYNELGRLPRNEVVHTAANLVAGYVEKDSPVWLRSVCNDAINALQSGRSFFALKPDDLKRLEAAFKTLHAVANINNDFILKRKFSILALGDSKAMTRIETTLANILRHYGVANGETEREIFESIGIVGRPDLTLISGGLILKTDFSELDASSFPYIGIPTSSLRGVEVKDLKADRVITIENEASFHEYVSNVKENHIAVFLSGYPNSGRIALLKAIWNFAVSKGLRLPFYHWGDIDFGGLDIIRSYREKTGINVIPHLMEPERAACSQFSVALNETQRERLGALVLNKRFPDLAIMAGELLKIGKRLEQESIEAKGRD